MKTTVTAASLALLLIFAFFAEAAGAFIMVYDIYTGGPNFMKGFTMFGLGAILFLSCVTCFAVLKNLSLTEAIAQHLYTQATSNRVNPLQALFSNFSSMPIIHFSSEEEFNKHKDEVLGKSYGQNSADMKQKLEKMSVEELKNQEQQAVQNQDFELAALIIQLIQQKTNS